MTRKELEDRLAAVTNQLLDLGKRNRLLNYIDKGLKTLAILNKNVEEVFRGVKQYRDFTFFPTDEALLEVQNNPEQEVIGPKDDLLDLEDDIVYEAVRRMQEKKDELICYKKQHGLLKALKALKKEFTFSIVEKGMNSLYLSVCFLHYKEEDIEYKAPLLLIPVEINNDSGSFIIRQYEDEIILNPTLRYYFTSVFNTDLVPYNNEALSTYLEKARAALPEGVELEEGLSLGIYSFYKMNMYNDLIYNRDFVLENANIRALLGEEHGSWDANFNEPLYPVVNCDSSQLKAIQYAANGKSFCLQGPPGSGKSQTITNMISSMLGVGKKILFVSEKIAALNVVYENLRRVRLSEFALELHSNKANKKEFIENMYRTATLPRYDIELKTRFLGTKYEYFRNNLNNCESNLHEVIPSLGVSLFDLYSIYLDTKSEPVPYELKFMDTYNLMDMDRISKSLRDYAGYAKIIGFSDYRESPLYGLNQISEEYIKMGLRADIEASLDLLKKIEGIRLPLKGVGLDASNIIDAMKAIEIADKIVQIKQYRPLYMFKKNRVIINDMIKKYMSYSKEIKTDILNVYKEDILALELPKIRADYARMMKETKGIFKSQTKEFKELDLKVQSYRVAKAKPEVVVEELNDLAKLKAYKAQAENAAASITKALGSDALQNLRQILLDIKAVDSLPDMSISTQAFTMLKNAWEANDLDLEEQQAEYKNLLNLSRIFKIKQFNITSCTIKEAYDRIDEVNKERNHISNYRRTLEIIDELKDKNAEEFLYYYLDNQFDLDEISQRFKKTFLKNKIDSVHHSGDFLQYFENDSIDDIIDGFRDLDEKTLTINRDIIIAKNSQKRQNGMAVEGSMFKILEREHEKKTRQKPIRQLLEQIFELALEIKPVFLMSPLSVSTYLANKPNMFDCVIFDEASQIFACDALGSIYRGKQCIIIGDDKQMPPSNFFMAQLDDNSGTDEELEYDLESILDKAMATFETIALKWHYRSRSEELITFSNNAFYADKLITVPTPRIHSTGFGVDFYYDPEGRYNTQTRTNIFEAAKVAKMVIEHYKNSDKSLGVVAFSSSQADEIQRELDKLIKDDPSLKKYFQEDIDEPFFIKNLETVQGDERDRIIFSICYAYNEDGKFMQRFGPLNVKGGERRLNVAVTRAKYNVSIVSSIRYTDIKTNTSSKGALLLRDYLEFAENVVAAKNYTEESNGIIRSVQEYLESLGYTVLPQYGSSAFKVDLAVKKDEDFIMAIMIDGKSEYSDNVTDTYRLEKLLLERQGWKYFKLFATNWVENQEAEKERLFDALTHDEDEATDAITVKMHDSDEEVDTYLRKDNTVDVDDFNFESYRRLDLFTSRKSLQKGIGPLVEALIGAEGPIHREYLYKRVANIMEKEKPNKEIKTQVDDNIPAKVLRMGDFFMNYDQMSKIKLRLNSDREANQIYVDEYMDGIIGVVTKQNGITVQGCYKTLVQILGFDKVAASTRKILDEALESLIHNKRIERRVDNLYLIV